MTAVKVKHWAGRLRTEQMKNKGWFQAWFKDIGLAEKDGIAHIVFMVLEEHRQLFECEIDQYIQDRLKELSIHNLKS